MAWFESSRGRRREASALACDNIPQLLGASSYGFTVNDDASTALTVAPGIYRVWLEGRSPTVTVYLTVGVGTVTAAAPDNSGESSSIAFSGDMTVRVRVPPTGPFDKEHGEWPGQTVAALLSAGAADTTLFFIPVLTWIDD
ncbi:MAG: hypothetical protein R3A52_21260 [Polyangiales bacterium]